MVKLEGSIRRYIGLSSDTKPVPGMQNADNTLVSDTDIPAGSSFFESDTGRIARWNGAAWLLPPPASDGDVLRLDAVLDELLRIRRVLEEVNGLSSDDLV